MGGRREKMQRKKTGGLEFHLSSVVSIRTTKSKVQNKLKLQTWSLAKLEISLEDIGMEGSSPENLIAREKIKAFTKGVHCLDHQTSCPLTNQLTTQQQSLV